MSAAPSHPQEHQRLQALQEYDILDTPPEDSYDNIVKLASSICRTPIALVSLVDADRQWFKATCGLEAKETPRSLAFCAHAILNPQEVFVVEDTHQHELFAKNPLVTGPPHIRFYAGAPILAGDGVPLGTVCVIDLKPRRLEREQIEALKHLACETRSHLELRLTARRLSALNKSNNRLFSILGHDLRSPLASSMEVVQLLQEDGGRLSVSEKEEWFDALEQNLAKTLDTLENLLHWSQLKGEERVPKIASVPVKSVVEDTHSMLRGTLRGKRIAFSNGVADSLHAQADRAMLYSILQNVIGNAIKFTPTGGSIAVKGEVREDRCLIEIVDTGVGLSDIQIQNLRSAGRARTTKGTEGEQGTGLGLTLCRDFADAMGASIDFRSTQGEGTTVEISLPLADSG